MTIEGIAAEAGIQGEEPEVRMEMFVGAGNHVSGGARAGNRLGQQSHT